MVLRKGGFLFWNTSTPTSVYTPDMLVINTSWGLLAVKGSNITIDYLVALATRSR